MNLFNKYTVKKTSGETDPKAEYFVLRIDKDPIARKALRTYAIEMWRQGEEEFAEQLFAWVDKHSIDNAEGPGIVKDLRDASDYGYNCKIR